MWQPCHGSLVLTTMSRGVLINPVFLLPNHPATAGNLSSWTCPVQRARLGAVTERLESVTSLARVPLVHDHLDRHPAAPNTGCTLGLVGSHIQPAMAPRAVDGQIRRNSEPGRRKREDVCRPFDELQAAGPVILDGFGLFVSYRLGLPADDVAHAELMLRMGALADAHEEVPVFATDGSLNSKRITQVAMASLVE